MAQDWFRLSLKDGELEPARAPSGSTPMRWIERDLESLLALNPNFLQVADHLPLRLGSMGNPCRYGLGMINNSASVVCGEDFLLSQLPQHPPVRILFNDLNTIYRGVVLTSTRYRAKRCDWSSRRLLCA